MLFNADSRKSNANLRRFTINLFLFLLLLTILPLGAEEKLRVDGDLTVKSADSGPPRYGLVVKPQGSAPANATEGQIYYQDPENKFYYRDNTTTWKILAGEDRYVATKIVAASDSLDTTCSDGVCTNPKADYTCNGTADGIGDQKEIQDAIDALGPYQGSGLVGGAVYLLEGTYNISSAINLDNTTPDDSGKAIIGTGRGTVLKVVTGASSLNVINASNVNRILISQLMIDGNNIFGTNKGILFSSVTYSKIEKAWVENIGIQGISLYSSSNNTISNNNLQGNKGYVIQLQSSSNNIISNNNVQDNGVQGVDNTYGINIFSSSVNNIVSNNNLQRNSGYGIYIANSPNNTISNNNVQGNGWNGIFVSTASYNTISNNNVQGNGTSTTTRHGIYLVSSSYNVISNNNVQDTIGTGGATAIYLTSSSRNTITGNMIYNNSQYGIILYNNSSANTISYNRLYKDTGASDYVGIYIYPDITNPCEDNYLIGNLIDGAAYAKYPIFDSGTNTKYTDKMKITLERVVVAPADGSTLDASTSPQGYIALNPTSPATLNNTTAIYNGTAIGDMLILEGNSTNNVTVPNGANTILGCTGSPCSRSLGLDDTLTLLWNGSRWVEVGWSDN